MPLDFSYYYFVEELPELLAATNALEARLRLAGNNAGADRVIRAYVVLRAELEGLGVNIAAKATEILRQKERDSRVRPDTQGGGGPRLGDSLVAEPLPIIWGSVGLANEDLLDQNVPWWSTNEDGSAARVGGVLRGVFEPGGAAPSPTAFREHPLFSPDAAGGTGVITHPIPARRFVEHSIPEVKALWLAGFDAIKGKFIAEVELAQVP